MDNGALSFVLEIFMPGMKSLSMIRFIGTRVAAGTQLVTFALIYRATESKRGRGVELDRLAYTWLYTQLTLLALSYALC